MLAELRKHAQTGAALSRLVFQKEAGRTVRALGRLGASALAHPVRSAVIGLGTVAAGGAAAKTYHSFNPAVQRKQLGMEP